MPQRVLPFSMSLLLAAMFHSTLTTEPSRGADSPRSAVETPPPSRLFRLQYHLADPSFCNAAACVDVDNDGRRDLFFASRATGKLARLDAADGKPIWSKPLDGDQQSISAFDLDGDGKFEILYTVSTPGRLYVLDEQGTVLRQWDAGDGKLGNSAVIIDGDGDGTLDGYLGSRNRYLLRLNMSDLSLLDRRDGWSQCGCHTSAMDVDRDGRWDLFAGDGDDFGAKGMLHRFDPVTLESLWTFATNDNASSADAVLVDLDGDGRVEIVKSVDNYKGDDAHDAVFAFTADGEMLWKAPGLAGEDSPNVADLDGDGEVEIVGMTFGGEVYCLDARGRIRWRQDLRPELPDSAHAYLTPILCDLDGDRRLEILALTNDGYFHDSKTREGKATAIAFALSPTGEILDRFDLDGPRYWGEAFLANVDDDPFMELVVSGSGGLDVIETRGFGPNAEYFQRRRDYRRLNVYPWAHEDTYFIERGRKERVVNGTDNVVLQRESGRYASDGRFVTDLLTLPPDCEFRRLRFDAETPTATRVRVDVLDANERPLREALYDGIDLRIREPVKLEFGLSTTDPGVTPTLHSYSLAFDHRRDTRPAPATALGQTVIVETGDWPRIDAPASIGLSADLGERRSLRLVETTDGKETPVPSQTEPGDPPRLWWIVRGETPARSTRTYRIDEGAPVPGPRVTIDRQGDFLDVRIGKLPVLRYNSAHAEPPEGADAKYGRSAFIDPVWTPAGAVVTDRFPPDHLHQSGIFLAHTKTEFEGRAPNFWDLLGGTGRVRFGAVKGTTSGPIFGEFRVEHEHVDLTVPEGKTALLETWIVRVWNVGGPKPGFWVWDLTSELRCATRSPLRLPKYHYGGMALRGARGWDPSHARFVTSERKTRGAGNHTRPRWCDLSGPVGERTAGITFLTHPGNFRFPEPLRIHPTMPYMVYTPSHLGPWEINPGAPHVSRYRFLIHDGDLPASAADRLWRDFSEPLVATAKAPAERGKP